ncbi:hypothetical protein C8R45DRAFT_1137208 [Mycena sanguinolenta]|nr:hypothetical protein C8R45DRAFT_1137208 [Mycena sanguinolenta]
MKSGVLANSHNDAGHRLSRNLQRQSKAARKAAANEKQLREQLKVPKGTSTGKNGTNAEIDLPFYLPPSRELAQEGVSGADFNFDPQFIDLLATSGLNDLFVLPDDDTYFPNYCVPDTLPGDGTTSESLMLPDSAMQTAWGPTTMNELLASDLFSPQSAYSAPDPNHAIYLGIGGDDVSQLPALLAPPSASVAGSPSPYPAPLPISRKRQAEVDEVNIIHSTRSAKVRENEDGSSANKRSKTAKINPHLGPPFGLSSARTGGIASQSLAPAQALRSRSPPPTRASITYSGPRAHGVRGRQHPFPPPRAQRLRVPRGRAGNGDRAHGRGSAAACAERGGARKAVAESERGVSGKGDGGERFAPGLEYEILQADAVVLLGLTHALSESSYFPCMYALNAAHSNLTKLYKTVFPAGLDAHFSSSSSSSPSPSNSPSANMNSTANAKPLSNTPSLASLTPASAAFSRSASSLSVSTVSDEPPSSALAVAPARSIFGRWAASTASLLSTRSAESSPKTKQRPPPRRPRSRPTSKNKRE